jgi:hypothetical protein
LKEAERARHQKAIEEPKSFVGRMKKARDALDRGAHRRTAAALASAQGRLRRTPTCVGRSAAPDADKIMRANLKWDADHHRNRLILHTLALLAAVPVALLPGPNVIGYLFTFTGRRPLPGLARRRQRASIRSRGRSRPCPPLTDLQHAFSLDATGRHRMISDVARRLHMPKMARFVEQMSAPS